MKKEKFKSICIFLMGGFLVPFIYDKIGYKFLNIIIHSPIVLFEYLKEHVIRTASNLAYSGNTYLLETIFFAIIIAIFGLGFDITYEEYKNNFSKVEKSKPDKKITKLHSFRHSKTGLIMHCVMYLLVSIFFLMQIVLLGSAKDLTDSTMQNIEIVAPYVDELEYKQLKSKFLQMNSYSDFSEISNRLNQISQENNIKLKNSSIY